MKSITSKIVLISAMLSIAIITVIGSTVLINQKNKKDAYMINIAGKQRMLTQNISKRILELNTNDSEEFESLDQALREYESSLMNLSEGNQLFGMYAPPSPKIERQLEEVRKLWVPFKESAERFKLKKKELLKSKQYFLANNEKILAVSDNIVKALVENGFGGRYIDLSGRQRMLSQRMAYQFMRFMTTGETGYLNAFYEAFGAYDHTLNEFYTDTSIQEVEATKQVVAENKAIWDTYSSYISEMAELQKEVSEQVSYILAHNEILLKETDEAVSLYTIYSEERREFLEQFQYASGLIILFLVVYSFLVIKGIRDHFADFLEKSKMLAQIEFEQKRDEQKKMELNLDADWDDELGEASAHLNRFIEKINYTVGKSTETQELSEHITDSLARLSENISSEIENLNIDSETKKKLSKQIDKTENMAIQSAEDIIAATRMLIKLKEQLDSILQEVQKHKES